MFKSLVAAMVISAFSVSANATDISYGSSHHEANQQDQVNMHNERAHGAYNTMNPGVVKESNPAGHPTNQQPQMPHSTVHVNSSTSGSSVSGGISATQVSGATVSGLTSSNVSTVNTMSGTGVSVSTQVPSQQAVLSQQTVSNPNAKTTISNVTASITAAAATDDSINVGVSSLKPNTPVTATINGVTQTLTASALARVNPNIQVSIPHTAAIISSPDVKGGQNSKQHTASLSDQRGNGEGNAAGTHSAHGLGGGSHIGGGSARGGGFHGSW